MVLFIHKSGSSPAYLHILSGQSWPFQYGRQVDVSQERAEAANAASMYTVYFYDTTALFYRFCLVVYHSIAFVEHRQVL